MPQAPTILLIEDDEADAARVCQVLGEVGAAIWHAESGADARTVLRESHPNLILLDLTLPDLDGLVLCATLKNEAPDVPFMVCSVGTTSEKVLSFKLGAEDFVPKPYEPAELQARIEAVLARHARRGAPVSATPGLDAAVNGRATDGNADLGRLRVDLARWRVTVDDKPLNLTPTEFQLLVFMARRPGEIISRQELALGVWGNESMSRSRTIDAYVRRIASKLSIGERTQADDWPPRILNIRGMGYQLSVPHITAAA